MIEQTFSGVVVRATGSWYEVLAEGERLQCRIRGKLRLKGVRSTNPVVVGDRVMGITDEQGNHLIVDIEPRRNYVILLIGLAVLLLGLVLMAGGGSDSPEEFNYEMFSFRRITLAPILVVGGFVIEIYGIMKRFR